MTAREVAAALRLPVKRVYELARSGDIPCLRFGRQVRFSRRAIERLVNPEPDSTTQEVGVQRAGSIPAPGPSGTQLTLVHQRRMGGRRPGG